MNEGVRQRSGSVPGLAEVAALIGPKLAAVEIELQRNLRSEFGPIDDAGRYLAEGGGKRVRPALVLLTTGLLGYTGEQDVLLGAVYEFIHTATLVHDDIIDEAETRRGRPSLNRVYGNHFTVLIGDYLYIRSMNMALVAGKLRLIEILAEAAERMIEGEILAHRLRGRSDVSREQHMQIVQRKTAWLFAGCCRAAAVLAGASERVENDLARFGMSLGIAFQLVDDLLDLTADERQLGKPVASDLREGRLTLPLIDLLERGGPEEREGVRRVLEDGSFERYSFAKLRAGLERYECLEASRRLAEQEAEAARQIMRGFPAGAYRDLLLALPDMLIYRDK
ncbi:MAG: polyprenyl synthetase family protein [Acidobacteriota bacterium]|nr:MAG: polyprenyl synthetase family protein [Acidobacteriota bacterium]